MGHHRRIKGGILDHVEDKVPGRILRATNHMLGLWLPHAPLFPTPLKLAPEQTEDAAYTHTTKEFIWVYDAQRDPERAVCISCNYVARFLRDANPVARTGTSMHQFMRTMQEFRNILYIPNTYEWTPRCREFLAEELGDVCLK